MLCHQSEAAILTSLTSSLYERHEVPNLDEIGLFFDLAVFVELSVLAHAEEQFVAIIDDFLDVQRLMVHHEWIARVVNHHILG